jgi:hypothetical protein
LEQYDDIPEIEVRVMVHELSDVDVGTDTYMAIFTVKLDWMDPKLKAAAKHDDVRNFGMWQKWYSNCGDDYIGRFICPCVDVANALEIECVGGESETTPGFCDIGHVYRVQKYKCVLRKSMDLHDYPFETHMLPISLALRPATKYATLDLLERTKRLYGRTNISFKLNDGYKISGINGSEVNPKMIDIFEKASSQEGNDGNHHQLAQESDIFSHLSVFRRGSGSAQAPGASSPTDVPKEDAERNATNAGAAAFLKNSGNSRLMGIVRRMSKSTVAPQPSSALVPVSMAKGALNTAKSMVCSSLPSRQQTNKQTKKVPPPPSTRPPTIQWQLVYSQILHSTCRFPPPFFSLFPYTHPPGTS